MPKSAEFATVTYNGDATLVAVGKGGGGGGVGLPEGDLFCLFGEESAVCCMMLALLNLAAPLNSGLVNI